MTTELKEIPPANASAREQRHGIELYNKLRPKDTGGFSCLKCHAPFGINSLPPREKGHSHIKKKCHNCGYENVI